MLQLQKSADVRTGDIVEATILLSDKTKQYQVGEVTNVFVKLDRDDVYQIRTPSGEVVESTKVKLLMEEDYYEIIRARIIRHTFPKLFITMTLTSTAISIVVSFIMQLLFN